MNRPRGVTVLAVIAVIYGIFSMLLALLGLIGSGPSGCRHDGCCRRYNGGTLAYAAISDALLGILYLTFGIGAFRLKGWAWTAGVIALVLDIVRQIAGFAISGVSIFKVVVATITIVIALLLIWYLFRPHVRAAFGKAA